jgi:hypothetical protein
MNVTNEYGLIARVASEKEKITSMIKMAKPQQNPGLGLT